MSGILDENAVKRSGKNPWNESEAMKKSGDYPFRIQISSYGDKTNYLTFVVITLVISVSLFAYFSLPSYSLD